MLAKSTSDDRTDKAGQKRPVKRQCGFASPETKREFLANPKRFPTDAEWDDMTRVEQWSFTASYMDDD